MQKKLEEAYGKMPAARTRFDKDLIKFDEQINIFHQLLNWQLLNLFPKEDDPQHTWYAPGDDLSAFSGKRLDVCLPGVGLVCGRSTDFLAEWRLDKA